MDASAIIPVLEQTTVWPAPFVLNMAAYDSELHKYNWNNEIIETPKHEIIFESMKFNLNVIVRPTTV